VADVVDPQRGSARAALWAAGAYGAVAPGAPGCRPPSTRPGRAHRDEPAMSAELPREPYSEESRAEARVPRGWPGRGWADLQPWLDARARIWARSRFGLDEGFGAEASQESLTVLLRVLRTGQRVRRPYAWLARATWRRLLSALRDRERHRASPLPEEGLPAPGQPPDEASALRDLQRQAPVLLGRLPPPWRQIAWLQFFEGWGRDEITRWLTSWRNVSPSHCRRLFRQTHAMRRRSRVVPRLGRPAGCSAGGRRAAPRVERPRHGSPGFPRPSPQRPDRLRTGPDPAFQGASGVRTVVWAFEGRERIPRCCVACARTKDPEEGGPRATTPGKTRGSRPPPPPFVRQ
jgi:DNA-directed RNA polymerase specialized sigma24 family protein